MDWFVFWADSTANFFEAYLSRDYASLEGLHTGELLNRLISDSAVISGAYVWLPTELMSIITRLTAALIYISILEWHLAILMCVCIVVLTLGAFPFRNVMKRYHKDVMEQEGQLRSYFQEMLENTMVVRSFQMLPQTIDQAAERMEAYKAARLRRRWMSLRLNTIGGLAIHAAYLFGLGWCGLGIINGVISFGTLSAVWQLIGQITDPARRVTAILPRYFQMTASLERIAEIADYPEEECSFDNDWKQIQERFTEIVCKNVFFSYRKPENDRIQVFMGLNLRIHRGDFVAITGVSGKGKSTLLKLLLAIYRPEDPESLRIRMEDGSSTVLDAGARALFSYVPQGSCLMSGTIMEAIQLGAQTDIRDASGQVEASVYGRVKRACEIACADEFIEALPDGYDARLGEKGLGLSEGQIQRIAIARAVYSEKPILLLDECTSALDERTEARVLEHLRQMTGCTVLIVTHRPAALGICNRVIEIRNGRAVEDDGKTS